MEMTQETKNNEQNARNNAPILFFFSLDFYLVYIALIMFHCRGGSFVSFYYYTGYVLVELTD